MRCMYPQCVRQCFQRDVGLEKGSHQLKHRHTLISIFTACFKIRSINKMNVLSNEQFMQKMKMRICDFSTIHIHFAQRQGMQNTGYAKIRTFFRSIWLQILTVTRWLPVSFHGSFLLTFFNYGFDLLFTLSNFPDRKKTCKFDEMQHVIVLAMTSAIIPVSSR